MSVKLVPDSWSPISGVVCFFFYKVEWIERRIMKSNILFENDRIGNRELFAGSRFLIS